MNDQEIDWLSDQVANETAEPCQWGAAKETAKAAIIAALEFLASVDRIRSLPR